MKSSHAPHALWIVQEPDAQALAGLQECPWGTNLPPLLQRLLSLRGISGMNGGQDYLQPRLSGLGDPFTLPHMAAAVARIFEAVDRKEDIILYGDYDVDGVTSLTLMTLTLRAYGLSPQSFLPHRMEEGYGLSQDGLSKCFETHGKPQLLIALDCGTSSASEVAWMKEQGVDCIIVDHHEAGQSWPECVAVVNPKLTGEQTYFCTVGLVFKLAHALLKTRRLESFDLREHLDLVALGTVADLVPLQGENRMLVRKGLERLADTPRKGLKALKAVAGVDGFIQSHHIGYRLGPRLNAAGRLDTAQTALDLLLCEDAGEARDCADLLDAHNRDRQDVEATAHREALALLEADASIAEAPCIVLGSRSWHPGVVGIVASRLMREYHRPTLMIGFDENGVGKGSGRSVAGVSLVVALDSCRSLILKGGGHAMAAGLSLHEANLPAFRLAMQAAVQEQLLGDELTPKLLIDAELKLADLTPEFLALYMQMEPFGMGNPEPLFLCREVHPQLPGNVLKEKHWKLTLRQGDDSRLAMWFNAPVQNPPPSPWDVVLRVQRQVWRGQESWQLMVSDVRSSPSGTAGGR